MAGLLSSESIDGGGRHCSNLQLSIFILETTTGKVIRHNAKDFPSCTFVSLVVQAFLNH
jgi:hypothetical protein